MGRKHTLFLVAVTSSDSFEEFAQTFHGFEIEFMVCHRLNEFWFMWFTQIDYPEHNSHNISAVDRAARRLNGIMKTAGPTVDGFGIYIRWDGAEGSRFEKVYESSYTCRVCIERKDRKIVVCKKREDHCVELRSPLSIVWLAVECITPAALAYKHAPKVILFKSRQDEPHEEDPLLSIREKMRTLKTHKGVFLCRFYATEDKEECEWALKRLSSCLVGRCGDDVAEDELSVLVDADIASTEKIKTERAKAKAIENIRTEIHSAIGWIRRLAVSFRADAAERGMAFGKDRVKETAEDQVAEDQTVETAEDQAAEDQVAEDQTAEAAEAAEDQTAEAAEAAEAAEDQTAEDHVAEDQTAEAAEDQAAGNQSDSSDEYELGSVEKAMEELGFYEVGSKKHADTKNKIQRVRELCEDLKRM